MLSHYTSVQRRVHLSVRREYLARVGWLRFLLIVETDRRRVVAVDDLGQLVHRQRRAVLLLRRHVAAGDDAQGAQRAMMRCPDLVLVHVAVIHHQSAAAGAAEGRGSCSSGVVAAGGASTCSAGSGETERSLRAHFDSHRGRFWVA